MSVNDSASVFLHPFRSYLGHESNGIGASSTLVESYESDTKQRNDSYMVDKKLKQLKVKVGKDPDNFYQRLLNTLP